MATTLRDGVRGCLLGGAIGDALGAPVENWHWTDVRDRHGRVAAFHPQPARSFGGEPGQVTDDSTLRHYLALAITRRGGRVGPDDYARVWLEVLEPARLFVTERIVLEKLRLGMSPWDTGRGQLAADAATMALAPVGVINAGDPEQAYRDGVALAAIHQDGLERDAAAATAAGVAAALVPGTSAAEAVDATARHASYGVRRLVAAGVDLAERATGWEDLYERFYATLLDPTFLSPAGEPWDPRRSVAATSREVLPAVVAALLTAPTDATEAVVGAAGLGRDADTIASVTGCFAGALHGAGALRPDWVDQVEAANRDLFEHVSGDPDHGFAAMADDLVAAVRGEAVAARTRADLLEALLTEV